MYHERASRLPGAFAWTSTSDATAVRILPDGCMDLLWYDGRVFVAGPDTRAHLFAWPAGTTMTGLRFAPGFAPRVIGAPACEFTNDRVPLDAVWSASAARQAVDRVAASADPASALEALASQLSGATDSRAHLVEHVVDRVRKGEPVTAIASAVGLSSRQLHRRCLDAFGYGAKTLTRVLRMVNAIEIARAGIAFAETAARAGYADQAHLARDVKEFAGVPLGQLVSVAPNAANKSTALPSGS